MDNFSQETRDFLIVTGILLIGGVGFIAWNSAGKKEAPIEESPAPVASIYDRKISCRIESKLKAFVKCDEKEEVIRFYQGDSGETPLFEIAADDLLRECEDRECARVEIPKELKQGGEDMVPKGRTFVFPNYVSLDQITDMVREEFKKTPPMVGDEVRVRFLSVPENIFASRYEYMNIQAKVINYRRNKNKVIELFKAPAETEITEDMPTDVLMGNTRSVFYSFTDLEEQLETYLDQLPDVDEKKRSIGDYLHTVSDIAKSEKKQIVILGVDDSITFPKARSYPLDETGYSWFQTYQKRFNIDIYANNRKCAQNGYKGCKLKEPWEETFAEYYLRQNETLLPKLKSKFAKDKFSLELIFLAPDGEKDNFERERDQVLESLGTIITQKITH